MGKLSGYAHVSTRQQDAGCQVSGLLHAGVRRDDLYINHGVSEARGSRPRFDKAVIALEEGRTLVITTLDCLGWSMPNLFAFAEVLRGRGVGLRALNLGGGVGTVTPTGSMMFPVMANLAQVKLRIQGSRIGSTAVLRVGQLGSLGERRPQNLAHPPLLLGPAGEVGQAGDIAPGL